MRTAILLLTLLPTATLAEQAPDDTKAKAGCVGNKPTLADQKQDKGGVKRLDQLPPANHQLTVVRSVDGCQKPVIVRYGVDGRARPR